MYLYFFIEYSSHSIYIHRSSRVLDHMFIYFSLIIHYRYIMECLVSSITFRISMLSHYAHKGHKDHHWGFKLSFSFIFYHIILVYVCLINFNFFTILP